MEKARAYDRPDDLVMIWRQIPYPIPSSGIRRACRAPVLVKPLRYDRPQELVLI
jgi:hypothetical protein